MSDFLSTAQSIISKNLRIIGRDLYFCLQPQQKHVVHCLCVSIFVENMAVINGGTDSKIRFWDKFYTKSGHPGHILCRSTKSDSDYKNIQSDLIRHRLLY